MFNQIHSREFHDLPDFPLILSLVTLALALLTHRLRFVRADEPHAYAISEKLPALGADKNIFFLDLSDVQLLQRKRSFLPFMVLAAIDPDKTYQRAEIGSFL